MSQLVLEIDKIKQMMGLVNEQLPSPIPVEPSSRALKSICDSEKFCKAQGPITFGQLKGIINAAISERIGKHVGEGAFKALLRLIPWFLPQIAVAGFGASILRAMNKIIRPSLTETQNYKTWWGKTILRLMDSAEGDLPLSDPFSRIFFISDGLMNMMNEEKKMDKTKVVRKTRFTRLKKILMDRNITQTELSRLTGIPAYKISLITSGRTNNLYMTTAKKICEVLQVNLDDALGDIVNG